MLKFVGVQLKMRTYFCCLGLVHTGTKLFICFIVLPSSENISINVELHACVAFARIYQPTSWNMIDSTQTSQCACLFLIRSDEIICFSSPVNSVAGYHLFCTFCKPVPRSILASSKARETQSRTTVKTPDASMFPHSMRHRAMVSKNGVFRS